MSVWDSRDAHHLIWLLWLALTSCHSRPVHVLCRERPRYRNLQLRVRQTIHPQQLQGGASNHQDCRGREALHTALWSSWRLAEALGVLDDSGDYDSMFSCFNQFEILHNLNNLIVCCALPQFISKIMHCECNEGILQDMLKLLHTATTNTKIRMKNIIITWRNISTKFFKVCKFAL